MTKIAIIRKEDAEALKEANVSQKLIKRLEQLSKVSESIYDQKSFKTAANTLKRLQKADIRAKERVSPDSEGWYDALFTEPTSDDVVLALKDNGDVIEAYKESIWYDDNTLSPVSSIKRWKPKGE